MSQAKTSRASQSDTWVVAVVERRLGQAFLVDPRREEQFVGDDGVVHAHAAFVENAQDRLSEAQRIGDLFGDQRRAFCGTEAWSSGLTWAVLCLTEPVSSQV